MSCRDNMSSNRDMSKVTMLDEQEVKNEKRLAELIKNSPKVDKMLKIQVSQNTAIYRKKGTDPEKAKAEFLKRYPQSII